VAQVITSTGGYHELVEIEFGRVYKWPPEVVTLQCTGGKQSNLGIFVTDCEGCGADYAPVIREWLASARRPVEDETHPWLYAGHRGGDELPF
jgi:hypothetical protein